MRGQIVLEHGAIAIDEGKIVGLGPTKEVERKFEAKQVLDASNSVVLPGLINTHTHLAMTLFRGVNDDLRGLEWLNRAWSIESNLSPSDVYWGALLGCLEMIRSGTTCFADHYFFMDRVAKAVDRSGIRAALAQAVFDTWGPKGIDTSLEGSLNFAKRFNGAAGGRISCMLGPHSTFTCYAETLKQVREAASATGFRIHLHLAERVEELQILKERYGKTPVRFLEEVKLLGPDLLGAHVIYVDEEEISMLKRTDTKVNHNPIGNTKGASGTSPVPEMLKRGVNVSLGTDGAGSNNNLDMFEEMKVAAIIHKLRLNDPAALSAWEVLEMATLRGARALGLEGEIGTLEVGKRADLILIRLNRPHLVPIHNLPSLLVYSANGNDVDTVIVDGRILMKNREVLTLKEDEVLGRAQEVFEGLLEKSGWKPLVGAIPEKISSG